MKPLPPVDLEPAEALARLTAAQALSREVIEDLLAVAPEDLDSSIDTALARLGTFCRSDRTYIFQRTVRGLMDNTHEWCAPGVEPMIAMLKDLPMEMADPWWPVFDSHGLVYIADVLELLADDPLREILEVQGIRSLLAVPLREDRELVGFMGYDSVAEVRSFLQGEIFLIQAVANTISAMLTRRRIEAEMAEARRLQDLEHQRLKATLSALPDVVLELDSELSIAAMHVNDRVSQPLQPDRVLGQPLTQVFPHDAAALEHDFRVALERDGIVPYHLCRIDTAHSTLWYSISAARRATRSADDLPGYVVILRDVTERRAQRADIERLSQIVRNTTNMVITTDAEGRIEWLNQAFETRTGFSLLEARGHKPGDLLQCPETDPATIARIRDALALGQPVLAEVLNQTKSGEKYWVELNIQPVLDDQGTLTGFMSVQSETTQRHEYTRKLQAALEAEETSRGRLNAAVEIMHDGFILFDAEQRLVLFNKRFETMFPEIAARIGPESTYREVLEIGVKVGSLARKEADPERWIKNEICAFSLRLRSSGTMRQHGRWLSFSQTPTLDGGRIILFSDVTELKDAEQRAVSDRARAMDAAHDGFALVSEKGTLLYANSAALNLLGIARKEDAIGRHWQESLHANTPSHEFDAAIQQLDKDNHWNGMMRLIRLDGQAVDVEVSAARNTDGGILLILRDITDRLQNEAERERLRETLALASRRADQSLLALGLTHDFNNLLATIATAASLIEEDGSPLTRTLTENIGAAVDQAAGLVRRLMSLGRQSQGKTQIDLREPMRDAATLIEAGLRPPLRLELSLPDQPVRAQADSTALMQMALNLSINARDALMQSPPQDAPGVIRLEMTPISDADRARKLDFGTFVDATDYIRIEISDNGPGMDAKTRAEIFTPYFTTKGDKGTGLGVPIAVEAVLAHNGALSLRSTRKNGTCFTIFLPVA
ncbi:MAG: PAS domain S-box protein [Natronohydrobacter sp.]|nr:PAS domain S-box protein [Natronohydrobacter sp.]